jgi:hypothetical protein
MEQSVTTGVPVSTLNKQPASAVPYLKSRTVTIKATKLILEAACDRFTLDGSVKGRET